MSFRQQRGPGSHRRRKPSTGWSLIGAFIATWLCSCGLNPTPEPPSAEESASGDGSDQDTDRTGSDPMRGSPSTGGMFETPPRGDGAGSPNLVTDGESGSGAPMSGGAGLADGGLPPPEGGTSDAARDGGVAPVDGGIPPDGSGAGSGSKDARAADAGPPDAGSQADAAYPSDAGGVQD